MKEGLAQGDEDNLVSKELIDSASKCLSELGIVFPMATWIVSLTEEHSVVLKDMGDAKLGVVLRRGMKGLVNWTKQHTMPPPAARMSDFDSCYAKAVPAWSFRDAQTQKQILAFVTYMGRWCKDRCQDDWAPFFASVRCVSQFLSSVPPLVTFTLDIYRETHAVSAALKFEVGQLQASASWQTLLGPLLRALESATKFLAELPDVEALETEFYSKATQRAAVEDAKPSSAQGEVVALPMQGQGKEACSTAPVGGLEDCVAMETGTLSKGAQAGADKKSACETLRGLAQQGKGKVDRSVGRLRFSYDELVKSRVASLSQVAGGDGPHDWVSKDDAQRLEWDALLDVYKTTLKKCKVSVLDAELQQAETLFKNVKEFGDFFGVDHGVALDPLLAQSKRGLCTRGTGILMQLALDLDKDSSKMEAVRTRIRKELVDVKENAKEFGVEFAYAGEMPKALVQRANKVIAMTRT